MDVIDARGLSCPEPVVLVRSALRDGKRDLRVLVDAVAARENVSRFVCSQGLKVAVIDEANSEWALEITGA